MTSNTVRIWTAIGQVTSAILGGWSVLTAGLPTKYTAFAGIAFAVITAAHNYAMSVLTPATNQRTPDNVPPKPTA